MILMVITLGQKKSTDITDWHSNATSHSNENEVD
jgi:hypothetical protein